MTYKEYCLCYISKKSSKLTLAGTETLLAYSNQHNKEKNITGVLIEYVDHFLQYIEGDPIDIFSLFQKISKDDRHEDVSLLIYKPLEKRLFSEWSMTYRNIETLMEQQNALIEECVSSFHKIMDHREFWRSIEIIEAMSNVNVK